MNVRKVTFTTDKKAYGVELRAEPQIPVLGKRLGKGKKASKIIIKIILIIYRGKECVQNDS